eukprot:TRINITY_DN7482_c0_g1_i1.p1 TRINITY_DN7482_c0_g1~~TRINITY_DN7482_c0_g1_i1.p1  ORF type:complete len:93 (-),score=5.89 TRINITY_DN7482_c0_g1_i1:411-689(-)
MLFKLLMTSGIVIIPNDLELVAGMICVGLYLIFLLLFNPYVRNGDYRLHLIVQVELLCLYMIAWVMQSEGDATLDETTDILISALLISITIF